MILSDKYEGILFITKSCTCKVKDKNNWTRVSDIKGKGNSCIVSCSKCCNQWRSSGKKVLELKKAPWVNK